jgi:hypothetical protein
VYPYGTGGGMYGPLYGEGATIGGETITCSVGLLISNSTTEIRRITTITTKKPVFALRCINDNCCVELLHHDWGIKI